MHLANLSTHNMHNKSQSTHNKLQATPMGLCKHNLYAARQKQILFSNSKANLPALQKLLPLSRAYLMQECNMQTCKDLKEAIAPSKLHEIKQTHMIKCSAEPFLIVHSLFAYQTL